MVNLSSGVPLDDTSVLKCWKIGEQKYKDFVQECLSTNQTAFHESIKINKISLFKQTSTKISKNRKTATIEVNRNMIGKLLAISAKCEKVIDFEVALSFALTSTPLSLSNPDGTRRVTHKSKQVEIIQCYQDEPSIQRHVNDAATFVVDFIALVRIVTKEVPQTFEDLSLKILGSIPKGYNRVDFVADTYRNASIKTAERNKRGANSKINIKSVKSRIPQDFIPFCLMVTIKPSLLTLSLITSFRIKSSAYNNSTHILLYCQEMERVKKYLLLRQRYQNVYLVIKRKRIQKVIPHTLQALNESLVSKVHLRSPSADADILVIALNLIPHIQLDRVFYGYGVGKHRNCLLLSDFQLPDDERLALIGFHAAT